MSGDRVDNTLVQGAADQAFDRPRRRRLLVLGFVTAVLLASGLTMFLIIRSQLVGQVDELKKSVTALAEQVTGLGGTPVVQPPGIPGPTGPSGRDGANGRDGRDGVTPVCMSEPPQCRGADGEPGEAGASGTPGQDGQNGQDGTPGKDGQDGVDGRPPTSWTWIDGDGRTQSCARDASSPDASPTYTCTAPSNGPPGTTTTTPPPLLGRR